MADVTLAAVIHRAIFDHAALEGAWRSGGDERPPLLQDHIAAAVTAWMQSDAAIERAARAFWSSSGDWDGDGITAGMREYTRNDMRAAVRALVGGGDG